MALQSLQRPPDATFILQFTRQHRVSAIALSSGSATHVRALAAGVRAAAGHHAVLNGLLLAQHAEPNGCGLTTATAAAAAAGRTMAIATLHDLVSQMPLKCCFSHVSHIHPHKHTLLTLVPLLCLLCLLCENASVRPCTSVGGGLL
jgi:hypothetical protein